MTVRLDSLYSIFAVIILVSTLMISIQSTQASSAVNGSTVAPFDFPYYYQQPSVPSSIGAQGIQGPTVPLSQIGVQGAVGATGHVGVKGSNPYTLPTATGTTSFVVYVGNKNGIATVNPHAEMTFTNLITGKVTTKLAAATTAAVTFTGVKGYYWVTANASSGTSGYTNFSRQMDLTGSASSIEIYLLKSVVSHAVNNGGTGVIWFSEQTNQAVTPLSELNVTLQNSSNGNAVLRTGNTLSNGSIEFTGLDTAFSYRFFVNGYENAALGIRDYMFNVTTSSYSFAGTTLVVADGEMAGQTSTTGSQQGTSLPTNGSGFATAGTVITGGITYISTQIQYKSGAFLVLQDATVYMNDSWSASGTPSYVHIYNSTLYFLTGQRNVMHAGGHDPAITMDNSVIYGDMVRSSDSLSLGFVNASNSLFYFIHTNYPGAIYGTFYNDVILNSSGFGVGVGNGSDQSIGSLSSFYFNPNSNYTRVSVINSAMTGGNIRGGTVNWYDDLFSNATTGISFLRMNATNVLLNTTPETGADSFNAHWLNISHSSLIFSSPANVSFVQYARSVPSDNFGYGPGPWLQSDSFSTDGPNINSMTIGLVNMTYTYVGRTFPAINLTITFGGGGFRGRTQFYNDWLNLNWSMPQFKQAIDSYYTRNNVGWPDATATSIVEDGLTVIQAYGQIAVNYTRCDMGGNGWFQIFGHIQGVGGVTCYWEHDIFPWTPIQQNQYSPFVLFPGSPPGQIDISNTTFGYIYFWWKAWVPGDNKEGEAMIWMETDTNQPFTPLAYINITHDTFDAPSFGSGANGMAGNVQFAKFDIVGTVAYCKFLNSPSYVKYGPDIPNNSSYRAWYLPPYQDDILASAANVTIHDNYFLNLTNLTAPIGTNQAYQNGGYGGNTTEYNNYFYYMPFGGMTYVNETWGFSNVGFYGTASTPNGAYNGSHTAYEIPIGQQATMTVQNGGDYIYNSTIDQTPPSGYIHNDKGYTKGAASQWSWIIEPDFVWNGSAYVARYQGVGGPQPNLSFQGHRYSWSFEPNRTYISADSLNAPSIPVAFSLPNSGSNSGAANLYCYNYSTGRSSLLESVALTWPVTNLSVLYKPSEFGTQAIFWVNSTSTGTLPPPSANYTVSFHELGLPVGTTWSVNLNGINETTTGANIAFTEVNGSYNFSIGKVLGYSPSIPSGAIYVNGANVNTSITFAKAVFKVTFNAKGLSGEIWSISLGNSTQQSSSSSIVFYEANGTYSYSVTAPSHFMATPTGGRFIVSGQDVNTSISFNLTTSTPTPTPPTNPSFPVLFVIGGLSFTIYDLILLVSAVAVISAIASLVIWRKRR